MSRKFGPWGTRLDCTKGGIVFCIDIGESLLIVYWSIDRFEIQQGTCFVGCWDINEQWIQWKSKYVQWKQTPAVQKQKRNQGIFQQTSGWPPTTGETNTPALAQHLALIQLGGAVHLFHASDTTVLEIRLVEFNDPSNRCYSIPMGRSVADSVWALRTKET